jgi:hypothetical protein
MDRRAAYHASLYNDQSRPLRCDEAACRSVWRGGIVVNSCAADASPAGDAHAGWQAGDATGAGSMLPTFPAQALCRRKSIGFI